MSPRLIRSRKASPRLSDKSPGKFVPRWMGFASAAGVSAAMPAAAAAAIIPISPATFPAPAASQFTSNMPSSQSRVNTLFDFNLDAVDDLSFRFRFDFLGGGTLFQAAYANHPAGAGTGINRTPGSTFAVGAGGTSYLSNYGTTSGGQFNTYAYGLPPNAPITLGLELSGGKAGWIRILLSTDPVTNRYTSLALLAGAYEDSGAPIEVGAVPEPSTLALGLLAAGAIGVAALKRSRRRRP